MRHRHFSSDVRSRLATAAVVFAAIGIGCQTAGSRPSAAPAAGAPPVSAAPAPRGLDPLDMDRSAPPCGDFYRYADGGWLKRNPVPADYPSWGAFNELDERNRETLHGILEKLRTGPPAPAAPLLPNPRNALC